MSENRLTDDPDIDADVYTDTTFDFDGTVELTQGGRYAVAIQLVAVGGQTSIGIWTGTALVPGTLVTSANAGVDWTFNASWDLGFAVYGSLPAAGGGGGGGNIPTDVTLFESWGF